MGNMIQRYGMFCKWKRKFFDCVDMKSGGVIRRFRYRLWIKLFKTFVVILGVVDITVIGIDDPFGTS